MLFVDNFINKNEIPGELWCEKMIPWHVKIMLSPQVKRSLLLWLHNALYLYLTSLQKISKKNITLKWFGISLTSVYVINRTLHASLEKNFPLSAEKFFSFPVLAPLKYFWTLEEKFHISVQPCYNLYICLTLTVILLCTRSNHLQYDGVNLLVKTL